MYLHMHHCLDRQSDPITSSMKKQKRKRRNRLQRIVRDWIPVEEIADERDPVESDDTDYTKVISEFDKNIDVVIDAKA